MLRGPKRMLPVARAAAVAVPSAAKFRSWEIRQKTGEANREVARERAEAARERREARRKVSRAIPEAYRDRWHRDGRKWGRDDHERRYYGRCDDKGSFLPALLVDAPVVGVVAAMADADKD